MAPRRTRTTRVSDVIARRIQRQISSGKLRPGEKLPAEREMARRYTTSRVSVREAYRSLEELGLLIVRRGAEGGAFVAEVGHDMVKRSLSLVLRLRKTSHEELTEARLIIEPPVARLAARRARPEDIARLKLVIERQEAALARNGHFRPFSLLFHRTLAECARNLPLTTLMNSLADLTAEVVSTIDTPRAVKEGICEFHRAIYDAVASHDEEAAHRLMLQHITQVQSGIGETIEQQLGPTAAGGAEAATVPSPPPARAV